MSSLPQQYNSSNITKVAILGTESTGKTTLCQDLAKHFDTTWVPEYMRPYLQKKWDEEQEQCTWEDLIPIAIGQIESENQYTQLANNFIFCDTTLFELMVYAYWYYGKCPQAIEHAALEHRYELILLTEIDVPWQADDLRDAPHQRHQIDELFVNMLNQHQIPFYRIGGTRKVRVATVADWLTNEKILNNNF